MLDQMKAMAKEAATKVTGTELERKIADACSNKPWGASTTMMSEIARVQPHRPARARALRVPPPA